MDPNARKAVNLNVLRRHDDKIIEIVDSSSYVVVYKFDHEHSSWVRLKRDICSPPPSPFFSALLSELTDFLAKNYFCRQRKESKARCSFLKGLFAQCCTISFS